MNNLSFISVIIPCFNDEKYLLDLLISLERQTLKNFEIIFVNDGSFDNSKKIFFDWKDNLSRKDINIIYLQKENGGASSACRLALQFISSPLLTWVDADDYLFPQTLKTWVDFFETHSEYLFARSNGKIVSEDLKEEIGDVYPLFAQKEMDNFFEVFLNQRILSLGSGLFVMRTSLFKKIYPHNEFVISPIGQNYQFILPASSYAKCAYIPFYAMKYRQRDNSHSHQKKTLKESLLYFSSLKKLISDLIPFCSEDKIDKLKEELIEVEKIKNKMLKEVIMKRSKEIKDKDISVIIPCYNSEKYLFEAVNSIKEQTIGKNANIIVVDDGSQDNSSLIAQNLNVTLLKQEHRYASGARNFGLKNVKTNWIYFLDADDICTKDTFLTFSKVLGENPQVSAIFSLAKDFISPELSNEEKSKLKAREAPYKGALGGAVFIHKKVIDEIGYFNEELTSGEGVDFILRIKKGNIKFLDLPYISVLRRIHLNNTGRLNKNDELKNYASIIRKLKERK